MGPGHAHNGAAFVVYLGDQVLSFGPGRVALPLLDLLVDARAAPWIPRQHPGRSRPL